MSTPHPTGSDQLLIPPALAQRPLVDSPEVDQLAALFRVLASDTRLRILHAIARTGEASVTEICDAVGESTQAVSNHLRRMADQRIVATRRDGTRIHYRLIDPCVGGLMELGLCLLAQDTTC
jgi:DNA-binding transcriptional ArsR family regulator